MFTWLQGDTGQIHGGIKLLLLNISKRLSAEEVSKVCKGVLSENTAHTCHLELKPRYVLLVISQSRVSELFNSSRLLVQGNSCQAFCFAFFFLLWFGMLCTWWVLKVSSKKQSKKILTSWYGLEKLEISCYIIGFRKWWVVDNGLHKSIFPKPDETWFLEKWY